MATHDYDIANQSGAAFRTDLNNALAAIQSNNSNSSSPATTVAYQWWADTNAGVLKIRNSSNNAWVELFQLDGTLTLEDGSASTPALAFRDDLDTGIFSAGTNQINFATTGISRLDISSDNTIFNESGANIDFRIEGDTVADLFFVDASENRIGIGTTGPQHDLDILKTTSGADTSFRVGSTANSGDNDATIVINNGGSGDASLRFDYESSTSRCKIYVSSSTNDLIFDTDGNETMRLSAGHNVGIGTTNPVERLVVMGTGDPTIRIQETASGSGKRLDLGVTDSGAVGFIAANQSASSLQFKTVGSERLKIDSSGRFLLAKGTPDSTTSQVQIGESSGGYTWDVGDVPQVLISGVNNEGATGGGNNIAFRIEDENANNMFQVYNLGGGDSDKGRVHVGGEFLVNTFSTTVNSSNFGIVLGSDGSGGMFKNAGGTADVFRAGGSAGLANIFGDGDITNTNNSYGQASDETLKQDIVDAASQWNDIKNLRVRKFRFKDNPTGVLQIGVVAQEIETVSAGLVQQNEEGIKSVKYSVLYMKAVKCLQEAIAKIEVLETKVAALEAA